MPHIVRIAEGQNFQDSTGLTVKVGNIDRDGRVHFSVVEDQKLAGEGEMSHLAFVNRFTGIVSANDACRRIRHLGYVASRRVRIYGEDYELVSDPFPDRDRIAIRARAKGDSRIRVLLLPVTIVPGRVSVS